MACMLQNGADLDHKDIQDTINVILKFLESYRWIIDSYVSDYFLRRHADRLPPTWNRVLGQLEPEELASLLSNSTWKSRVVWPLSLLAFRTFITNFCLKREPVECDERMLRNQLQQPISRQNHKDSAPQESSSIVDGQCMNLDHCYRRHVKPKKQHEILSLGKAINSLCSVCTCDHVVDVGAGQGHLSRLLGFGYGLKVTTVEAVGCHAPKAQKFDQEVKRDIQHGKVYGKKTKNKKSTQVSTPSPPIPTEATPRHVIATIDPSIPPSEFLAKLRLDDFSDPTQIQATVSAAKSDKIEQFCKSNKVFEILNDQDSTSCGSSNQDENKTSECQNTNKDNISETANGTCTQKHENNSHANLASTHRQSEHKDDRSNLVDEKSQQDGVVEEDNVRCPSCFVLTGLHACGDLTPTMLRVFVQCPQAVGLASVGCCYMKTTTVSDLTEEVSLIQHLGYPMSDYVRSHPNHAMSYEAREMACHFVECYHERLQEVSPSLRSHSYRAALQEVIADKHPGIKHGSIKLTIKHVHEKTFQDYASSALNRLGLDPTLTSDQLERAETRLERWRDVVAFYTLRLSLAPLLETVIVLDRILFLLEYGIKCCLHPIFDPKLSPRNFVLLATKTAETTDTVPLNIPLSDR